MSACSCVYVLLHCPLLLISHACLAHVVCALRFLAQVRFAGCFFGGVFIFLVFPLTPRFLFPFHPPYEQARPSLIPPNAPSTGHPASMPVSAWVQEDLGFHTPSENRVGWP